MKISARNMLSGRVKRISPGSVNAEVVIEIAGGVEIVASITKQSVERLSLAPGKAAYAVIKATSVMIAVD
jgi:molybdopterin-binding protein